LDGIIEIKDFEPDIVKNFLIFVYSGLIVAPNKIPDLYLMADKVRNLIEYHGKKTVFF
jgi:hypothetical protein